MKSVMDKGKFYSGLAIMLGLIVLGLMIPKAVREFRSFDRTVNVKGLCEREVEADKVIWPVVYKVMDNDLGNIYSVTDRNNAAIVEFLKSGGLQDSEITVSVPSISDKYANEYGNNDRTYRYIATNIVTVCTDKVDDVLALMSRQSELLRKGIVDIPIMFLLDRLIGVTGIAWATPIAELAACLAGILIFIPTYRRLRRCVPPDNAASA